MLLKVILVKFNESISNITQNITNIIMTMMMCFILSWQGVGIVSIVSSNKGRKNNIRIIGTVWELRKNNRQFFLGSAGKNNRWIFGYIRPRIHQS